MSNDGKLMLCPNPWCIASNPHAVLSHSGHWSGWAVKCFTCDVIGPQADSEAEAIAEWNNRPDLAQQMAEALRDLINGGSGQSRGKEWERAETALAAYESAKQEAKG